jgi:hypothetical protein
MAWQFPPVVGVWFPYPGNTAAATTGTTYYGQYLREDEVEAQWFGRGGIEPTFGHRSVTVGVSCKGNRRDQN